MHDENVKDTIWCIVGRKRPKSVPLTFPSCIILYISNMVYIELFWHTKRHIIIIISFHFHRISSLAKFMVVWALQFFSVICLCFHGMFYSIPMRLIRAFYARQIERKSMWRLAFNARLSSDIWECAGNDSHLSRRNWIESIDWSIDSFERVGRTVLRC